MNIRYAKEGYMMAKASNNEKLMEYYNGIKSDGELFESLEALSPGEIREKIEDEPSTPIYIKTKSFIIKRM